MPDSQSALVTCVETVRSFSVTETVACQVLVPVSPSFNEDVLPAPELLLPEPPRILLRIPRCGSFPLRIPRPPPPCPRRGVRGSRSFLCSCHCCKRTYSLLQDRAW